jgi:CrcB protein
MILVYLSVGGIIGTLCRYGLGKWIPTWAGTEFPWATFAINMLGSFVLGVFVRATDSLGTSPEVRAMLTVGFCGAFTTFSTFSFETATLMQEGEWMRAAAYSLGSLALGLVAMFAGLAAGAAFTAGG